MNIAAPVKTESFPVNPCAGCSDSACPVLSVLGRGWFEHCPGAIKQISARCGDKIDAGKFPQDAVFRVTTGMLMQEHVLEDGRRHIAAFKTNGDLLWPLPAKSGADIREYYEAVKPTEICVISVDALAESVEESDDLVHSLYDAARREVTRAQAQMFSLARSSATERLAWFLADMAERIGRKSKNGIEFKLNMRRERIADHLGMQPETISRIMSQFKKSNLIQLPRPTQVIIPDLRRLTEAAYGNA